jgi:hypothetical protein
MREFTISFYNLLRLPTKSRMFEDLAHSAKKFTLLLRLHLAGVFFLTQYRNTIIKWISYRFSRISQRI